MGVGFSLIAKKPPQPMLGRCQWSWQEKLHDHQDRHDQNTPESRPHLADVGRFFRCVIHREYDVVRQHHEAAKRREGGNSPSHTRIQQVPDAK